MPGRHSKTPFTAATILTVLLFAVWGFANRVHSLVAPQFTSYFQFNNLEAFLSYITFGVSYMVLAIPAAIFMRRFGYKLSMIAGLSAFSAGSFLFYPAVASREPLCYVAAMIATGSGWAILEASANPLMLCMGSPKRALQRLNLAQAVYPCGLILGAVLQDWFIAPRVHMMDTQTLEAVVRPYMVIGLAVLLVAFLIDHQPFPEVAIARSTEGISAWMEIKTLRTRSLLVQAMLAMAVYMIGLILLWAPSGTYAGQALQGISWVKSISIMPMHWIACGGGRLVGTACMSRIPPRRLLVAFSAIAPVCVLLAAAFHGPFGLVLLIAASFFIGIMFPTIFGIGVGNLGSLTKTASGLMVSAAGCGMVAGISLNWLFAVYATAYVALIVSALAFLAVLAFSLFASEQKQARKRAALAGEIA